MGFVKEKGNHNFYADCYACVKCGVVSENMEDGRDECGGTLCYFLVNVSHFIHTGYGFFDPRNVVSHHLQIK